MADMLRKTLRATALTLAFAGAAVTPPVAAEDGIKLPALGDGASSLFSTQQEYELGRAWLKVFRAQVRTVDDPLLQDYLEDLLYRLAAHSQLSDRRLDLVVVENPTMNAFAVPGGVVGVHTGLFMYADNEAQLASVLAHELAHLSQRHFARSVDQQRRASVPAMAGMLAALVLAATAGGDAGIAAMTATQAASLQSQLRYSRLHEQEADRIGMETLAAAGFDPNAAPAMFENMLQSYRHASRPPEFLLTHPLTESRVSDTRARARQHPRQMHVDNIDYQLMRVRAELRIVGGPTEAVRRLRGRLQGQSRHPEADHYGLALAYTDLGQPERAREHLAPLLEKRPGHIAYVVADARIHMSSGEFSQAIAKLERALRLSPDNHPLVMTYAEALLRDNQPHRGEALLQEHIKRHPENPHVWYLLAETHGLAGNIIGVHQARAEYFVLHGALDRARMQLGYALPLIEGDELKTLRIRERMREIEQIKARMERL